MLAVEFAINNLGMAVINADTIKKNERSQYVLQKCGFCFIYEDDDFRYYQIKK